LVTKYLVAMRTMNNKNETIDPATDKTTGQILTKDTDNQKRVSLSASYGDNNQTVLRVAITTQHFKWLGGLFAYWTVDEGKSKDLGEALRRLKP